MAFNKNKEPVYAQGISEVAVYDPITGNMLYWSNKVQSGNISTTADNGAVEGGLGNKLLTNIPHTTRVTGSFQAADFSLEARGLQMGATPEYNAVIMWREEITATSETLTVSKTPVPAVGESSSDAAYYCYVGSDGVNYGVDPETKEVQSFTATVGEKYCVQYYIRMVSAQSLAIPASFSPTVAIMIVKTPYYAANGANSLNSSLAGVMYTFFPRVQFVGGDAGLNGSQTEASTTSLNFESLAYDNVSDEACTNCEVNASIYGYMTFAPCGDVTSAVSSVAISGGGVSVAVGKTKQLPVVYIMEDGSTFTPDYTDLTYVSSAPATAKVDESGIVTGVAAGTTTIKATVTSNTALTATASVTVTAS